MPKLTIKEVNAKVDLLSEKVSELCKALKGVLTPTIVVKEGAVDGKTVEELIKNTPILVDQSRGCGIGDYNTYHFNNGEDYDIALADNNGTLIFKEAIFEAPFDDKARWQDCTNDWNKCTLKPLIEKWWDENAPAELKERYYPTILTLEEILPDCELPGWLKGQNKQLAIFKNIKERVKNLKGKEHLTWYWTRTAHRGYAYLEYVVTPDGSYDRNYADLSLAVVLACVPK